MTFKRWLVTLLIVTLIFIAGVLVGRFVMPRTLVIVTIDIKDLVDIIERYNEAKHELERTKEWNKKAIIESGPEEEEIEKDEN